MTPELLHGGEIVVSRLHAGVLARLKESGLMGVGGSLFPTMEKGLPSGISFSPLEIEIEEEKEKVEEIMLTTTVTVGKQPTVVNKEFLETIKSNAIWGTE